MVCESISYRITPVTEKTRKSALNPSLYVCALILFKPFLIPCRTDYVLFVFLEDYFGRLEGPIAMQVWGRFVALAKEIAGNVYGFKLQIFPCLR